MKVLSTLLFFEHLLNLYFEQEVGSNFGFQTSLNLGK